MRQGAESAQREQQTLATSTFTQTELKPQSGGRSIVRFARAISQYSQPLIEEAAMNAVAVVELKLMVSGESRAPNAPPLSSSLAARQIATIELQNADTQQPKVAANVGALAGL